MVTARAYEPDKEVVDVEDPPRISPTRRAATRDLIMHVQLDDGWHRMAADGLETACGMTIDLRHQIEVRSGRVLEHPLAEKCQCWTDRERAKANELHITRWGRPYEPWSAKR